MKRLQMIETMCSAYVHYKEEENIKLLTSLMDKILETVEQEGMLPPANKLTKEGKLSGYEYEFHYWEKE